MILAAGLALAMPATAVATPSAIRVGGPSSPTEAKVAIVGSDKSLKGKSFTVEDELGDVVLGGKLKKAKGKPDPWRHAYSADLSSIDTPGTYTVKTGKLSSRGWEVAADGSEEAIGEALGFFRANRDGDEASTIHDPSHLNDATIHPDSPVAADTEIDIKGGWMDAGDMIHFTQTTAFATAMLEASARLDSSSALALNAEADVGVRWLVAAHPSPGVFVAQVGDERDHENGFRDPAADDASPKPGIGSRFAYTAVGGDLGGKAAAALAMAYVRTSDPALLQQATEWYAAGKVAAGSAPKLKSAGYPDYAGGFYHADNWKDSMASGAAELYRATCAAGACVDSYEDDYIQFATSDQSVAYAAMGVVDDFSSFGAAEVCGAFGPTAPFSSEALGVGCDALAENGDAAVEHAAKNAFGMPGYFTWGTTAQNGAAGALAALAPSGPGNHGDCAVAAGARDYMLGRNPFGASLIVGYGPGAAEHPHHWASVFGGGMPEGAIVGGPAPRGQVKSQGFKAKGDFNKGPIVYVDERKNYVTSEPALDYSASSILMLAALRAYC